MIAVDRKMLFGRLNRHGGDCFRLHRYNRLSRKNQRRRDFRRRRSGRHGGRNRDGRLNRLGNLLGDRWGPRRGGRGGRPLFLFEAATRKGDRSRYRGEHGNQRVLRKFLHFHPSILTARNIAF